MAWTRRPSLGLCAVGTGVGLLVAAATAAVVAGGSAAAAEPVGCSASARVDSQWGAGSGGGQIVTVTVTNTASVSAARWTASWTLAGGQSVASAWGATVTTSGAIVTAGNMAYNGALAPGGSTSFGMQLSGVAPAPVVSCTNDASVPASPSPGPSSGTDVILTEADSGRTLTLIVGQTLRVTLPADYRPTTASTSSLVLVSTSGGYPTGQPLVEVYRAAAAQGSFDLSSQTDAACLHASPPCALPIRLWTVHLAVLDPTLTLTEADNDRTINLLVGQSIRVSLGPDFRPTTVSGPALGLVATNGGYPTGQPLVEVYRTRDVGSVDLRTITDFACLHAPRPCALPQRPWRVHVNVVGIGG